MNFLEMAKARYSVREYTPQTVEDAKLEEILSAGRICPTAANMQPQRILVVTGEKLKKLYEATNIYGAPLALIVCADKTKAWTRPFDKKKMTDVDATIATDHMMLEAVSLGLGTVWITYFKPDALRREFEIEDNLEPVNILAIGYAAGQKESPERHSQTRKPLDELVTFIK